MTRGITSRPPDRGHEAIDMGAKQQPSPAGEKTLWQRFRAEPRHIQAGLVLIAGGMLTMIASSVLMGLGTLLKSQGLPDLGLTPDSGLATAMQVGGGTAAAGTVIALGPLLIGVPDEKPERGPVNDRSEGSTSRQLPPDARKA
jgi:hypothetical protein